MYVINYLDLIFIPILILIIFIIFSYFISKYIKNLI